MGTLPFALSILEQKVSDPAFAQEYRMSEKDFTRRRCLGFKDTFFAVAASQKRSLQTEMSTFFIDAAGKVPAFSPQAFSKARYKITPGAFYQASRWMARAACLSPYLKKFRGYRIQVIDGTSLLLPDTQENRDEFGTCGNSAKTYASASASILYDPLNDIVLDAVIGRQFASEREDCYTMLGRTGADLAGSRRLAIMDRGYCSREMYKFLEEKGYKYIIRIQSGASTPKAVREAEGPDCVVTDARDGSIVQRAIKLVLPTGETEVLVTNLFDESFTLEDFRFLYHLRWPVEEKYLDIKHKLELEKFTGYRPDGIRQDFHCAMLMANLASLLKAAAEAERVRQPDTKWEYQIIILAVINVMRGYMVRLLYHPKGRKSLMGLMVEALKNKRSAIRPDRHAKRERPRTVKRYSLNRK